MNKSLPITLPYYNGCYHATDEQAAILFTPTEIASGEARLLTLTHGPWQILKSIRGWLTTGEKVSTGAVSPGLMERPTSIAFHSVRTMSRPRNNGYGIVGNMRFKGKGHRVIDIAPLVQIEDGKLISINCLHVCETR
jgi:hypothetical protein